MKALLFPGQGVQKIGMIDELLNDIPETKNIINDLSKKLDFDLLDLLTKGPEDKINLTEFIFIDIHFITISNQFDTIGIVDLT